MARRPFPASSSLALGPRDLPAQYELNTESTATSLPAAGADQLEGLIDGWTRLYITSAPGVSPTSIESAAFVFVHGQAASACVQRSVQGTHVQEIVVPSEREEAYLVPVIDELEREPIDRVNTVVRVDNLVGFILVAGPAGTFPVEAVVQLVGRQGIKLRAALG